MGYKILDVKEDILKDVEKYCREMNSVYPTLLATSRARKMQEDILDIVDKHFEKIER